MSFISEQIQKLRYLAEDPEIDMYGIKELNNAFKQAADTIETLSVQLASVNMERSSAYYNGGWIPYSEQMPEDGEKVLVWFEYYRYGNYNRLYQTHGISYTYDGKWSGFVNGSSGWRDLNIIAWQPLPKPYKE